MEHTIIYREAGRYAAWPANFGIWSWGDEIVCGFTVGYHFPHTNQHARDSSKPFMPYQARSLDGGATWTVQQTPADSPGGRGFSADEHMIPELHVASVIQENNKPKPHPGSVDFTHPDFALMGARTNTDDGSLSWFYSSVDRCRSWQGPYSLPMLDLPGIAARTCYLVQGPKSLLLFLTTAISQGKLGRVFCLETLDGGVTFDFVSWVGPRPEPSPLRLSMPSAVRLSETKIVTAIRCADTKQRTNWIDLYESDDNGRSWALLNRPVHNTGASGNPPSLIKLKDGRLCITYACRNQPYRICAKLSVDDGNHWSDEIVLRDDGGSFDIGYPRTVQRTDGSLVTVYYFNDRLGGEAYIAATIWRPE